MTVVVAVVLDIPGLNVGFCPGAVEESRVLVDGSVNYQFVTKFKITSQDYNLNLFVSELFNFYITVASYIISKCVLFTLCFQNKSRNFNYLFLLEMRIHCSILPTAFMRSLDR